MFIYNDEQIHIAPVKSCSVMNVRVAAEEVLSIYNC